MTTLQTKIAVSALSHHFNDTPLKINISFLILFLLLSFFGLYSKNVQALEVNSVIASTSYGDIKKNNNDSVRKKIIKQNGKSPITDQLIGKATGKSRELIKAQKQLNKSTNSVQTASFSKSSQFDHSFEIFSARSFLEEDIDGDGYYQTFSVIFDADVVSFSGHIDSEVYAELYLSKNGGEWFHYFTTDNFIIHGDSEDDEYEVITTLADGYLADNYDVLIDLYEEGYDDIVATYSSDDTDALYALPLESSNYDRLYIETIEISHGGSLSLMSLLFLLMIPVIRR